MKNLARVVAFGALCSSVISWAAGARDEPIVEERLSCLPAAKTFFNRAWDALANGHLEEARELFVKTVALDPACTLAWAHLGAVTPGPNGRRLVDDAVAGSSSGSEVERLQVRALAAVQRGEAEQALSLMRSALIYDPLSYHLNVGVAQRAAELKLWQEMVSAAQRATELAPERGAAWNLLGYGHVGLKQHELAVAAFRRYANVSPLEPKAHDALGDALLANNRLEEAKGRYERALAASDGTFWKAGQGVATVCALQADWFCARAAIEKARNAAPPADRVAMMEWNAWSYLAEDQPSEAHRAVDELEQDARHLGLEALMADARLLRGRFFLTQGRYWDALKQFVVLGPQKFPTLDEAQRQSIERRRLQGLVEAQARLGKLSEAEKTLKRLNTLFEARPNDPRGVDAIAQARGLIALHRKDQATAISEFKRCSEGFDACKLNLVEALDAAGESVEAKKTRALVRVSNHRDPEYWWVRGKMKEEVKDRF